MSDRSKALALSNPTMGNSSYELTVAYEISIACRELLDVVF